MIESKIIEKAEMIDIFPYIDIFSREKIYNFYKFFYLILRHKTHNPFILLFIRILFFFQLMEHSFIGVKKEKMEKDSFMYIFYLLRYFGLPHLYINSKKKYIFLLSCSFLYTFLLIFLLFYLKLKYQKQFNIYLVQFLGFLNCLLVNYLICVLINIFGLILKCEKGIHIYLNIKCYSDKLHIILLVIIIIFFLFFIFYSFLITIFFNEIGGIKILGTLQRTNTYFELFCYCLSLIIYIFGFIQNTFYHDSFNARIYCKIIHIIYGLILFFYLNKNVYFYKSFMNIFYLTGFIWISWYSFILLLTLYTSINHVVFFFIIGSLLIFILIYLLHNYKMEYSLFQSNILENENLKSIETFIYNFNSLIKSNEPSNKIYMHGIINAFEDYLINYKEEEELYQSLINNKHMKKNFGKNSILLKMNSIIYCIYHYFMEKSVYLKDDMLLLFCYFLVNNLKNSTYTIYLCSKKKLSGYKNNYLKYTLMSDINEYMIDRLLQNNIKNKDSIKHIEISKVILFNKYCEKLRYKIYDATQAQTDYFNFLKSNNDTSTEKFLIIGNLIINLRNEILELWNEIIELNPFCDEIEQDFIMYLDNIIQDDDLLKKSSKNFHNIKERKLIEKNNKYYNLFNYEKSCILLFDGYNNKGKLLYYTLNFTKMFYINNDKQTSNLYLEELIPKCLSNFHYKLIEDALEYSNLKNVFSEEKNIPIQIKDTLFNVNGYIKSLPSFSSGLIFIVSLTKESSNQFLIFLDNEFKIDSMTNISHEYIDNLNNKNYWIYPYNLKTSIIGNHISTLIPEFLNLIEYKNHKFIIESKISEHRGNIFPNVMTSISIKNKLERIFEQIKLNGKLYINSNDSYIYNYNNNHPINKNDSFIKTSKSNIYKTIEKENQDLMLYNNFFQEIKNNTNEKSYSIFFRLIRCSYFNNQYSFYKIFIQKDITIDLNLNELDELNNNIVNKKIFETHFEEVVPKVTKNNNGIFIRQITKVNSKLDENEENKNKKKIYHGKIKRDLSNIGQNNSNFLQNQISFNSLKQNIINKKTPQNVKYLRLSAFIFSILSLIIIIYNTKNLKQNFLNIEDFLSQNYFFNQTKQNTASLFISLLNFQLSKKQLLTEEIYNETFFNNSLFLIKKIIDDLLVEIYKVKDVKEEYKKLVYHYQIIEYYSLNFSNIVRYNLDQINILYFLISNTLFFINNTQNYFKEKNESIGTILENILNSSFNYSFSNLYGLSYKEIKLIVTKKKSYNINLTYIVSHFLLFVIFFLFFVWLIFKRFNAKKNLIEKMVNFQTTEFDDYLKYLDEIRRKISNDNEENKYSENNNENKINIKDDIINSNSIKDNKNNNIKKVKTKLEIKNEKEKRKKFHIIQLQKKEKKRIMINFYIFLEIFSSIKYCGILILFMIFYIIIFPIYIIKRKDFISFDEITTEIESVSINTYLSYIEMKKEIVNYLNFIYQKENCLIKLNKEENECIINNIKYTLSNITNYTFNYSIFKNNIPYSEDNILYLKLVKNLHVNPKSPEGELAKLYYGNMCEIILQFGNEINLNFCSKFWNTILTQGLQQSILYYYNLNNQVLNLFSQNKEENSLNYFNSALLLLNEIETYLLHYFYLAEKCSFIILKKIKNKKSNSLIKFLNFILFCIIVVYILLYGLITIFIEQTKKNFCSFANFLAIFPHKYVVKDEEFYNSLLRMKDFY